MSEKNYQEKTEEPTKRKLMLARKRGETAKSQELAAAFIIFGGGLLFWSLSSLFDSAFRKSFLKILTLNIHSTVEQALFIAFRPVLIPFFLFLLGMLIVAIASHVLQTGWIWSLRKNGSRMTSGFGLYPFFFAVIKLSGVSLIGYLVIRKIRFPMFALPVEKERYLFQKLFFLTIEVGAFLLLIGIFDLIYQKWLFYKKMKMTKEEVKEEKRETEGATHVKGRIHRPKG